MLIARHIQLDSRAGLRAGSRFADLTATDIADSVCGGTNANVGTADRCSM